MLTGSPFHHCVWVVVVSWLSLRPARTVATAKGERDGYSRPATTALAVQVYWTNNANLDRDKDGTACENG